jgi:hypothetical protein
MNRLGPMSAKQHNLSGTDVMVFKMFSPIFRRKKSGVLTQNTALLFQILSVALVFKENANFVAENCQNCDHNIDPWNYKSFSEARRQCALRKGSNFHECFRIHKPLSQIAIFLKPTPTKVIAAANSGMPQYILESILLKIFDTYIPTCM